MARRKATEPTETPKSLPPALTLEGRENQLIAAAYDLAEKRILEGTASSQELTYFLKMGSSKAVLERDRLREENKLLRAKTAALEAQADNAELLNKALKAFKSYRGESEEDEDDDDDYPYVY